MSDLGSSGVAMDVTQFSCLKRERKTITVSLRVHDPLERFLVDTSVDKDGRVRYRSLPVLESAHRALLTIDERANDRSQTLFSPMTSTLIRARREIARA